MLYNLTKVIKSFYHNKSNPDPEYTVPFYILELEKLSLNLSVLIGGTSFCVGEITRKCGFVNQKIRGRRPSNFLMHEFTLSSGFSGLNHKKRPCENQCYIYVA